MSGKDICFSNYSISVFVVFYNLFSHEKTGGKQFPIQKTLFFFFPISAWELRWLSSEEKQDKRKFFGRRISAIFF